MTNHANTLKKLLDEWEASKSQNASAKAISQNLLKEIEDTLSSEKGNAIDADVWHRCLHVTGKSDFLQALTDRDLQYRWAEAVFKIIRISNFTLKTMFDQRVTENPNRVLFQYMSGSEITQWSYEQIARHLSEIAAVLFSAVQDEPRVAIISENCVESACCDLACLLYDILDTPLSIHFNSEILAGIFKQLKINIVVTDTESRCQQLQKLRETAYIPFNLFIVNPEISNNNTQAMFLGERCKRFTKNEIDGILSTRAERKLTKVATIMFTSGSTGKPKGVAFSQYNLVTKRFARAAALPKVGNNEVLLCYLPLYHTFGRYLEMLGTIYWNGTYVFSENPSAEILIALFPKVNPSGFISVPIRWHQLQEKCLKAMDPILDNQNQSLAFRSIVGDRLRWGLSAAGYLDPKIFHFFQRNGVELCSGFGMTEATGGITMTPPGHYVDNSTGIPLPGVNTRIGKNGELQISGHYIAKYLDKAGPDFDIPYPKNDDSDNWLATGDLFRVTADGHYQIMDRIKDIYKNNKGQTVAPLRVEQKFVGVSGIKRTFLVGDRRAYNVLLVVPDDDDPIIKSSQSLENQQEYFHQLVTTANQDLAPYERVVNFAVLERDFTLEKGELTSKGSLNRKIIEKNFVDQIEDLYQSDHVELTHNKLKVKIPRWFFRDQGILETDIQISTNSLINRSSNKVLPLKEITKSSTFLIGDLEYQIFDNVIDLGLFAQQPKLWIGNPSLISFCPCKEGWDIDLKSVSTQVFRPWITAKQYSIQEIPALKQIRNQNHKRLNKLISISLFGEADAALGSIEKINKILKDADDRTAEVIRRRLEALARHPEESIRCAAYQILLLDEPMPDYSKSFPAFVHSGLTFLTEQCIEQIEFSYLEKRRLEALRQRLFSYRVQLKWPINKVTRQQFVKIFKLLVNFVHHYPEYYHPVRAELASWILHKSDPDLAKAAEKYFTELYRNYESKLAAETPKYKTAYWNSKLVFEDGMTGSEVKRIKKVLIGTTFLKQSIILAFDEKSFNLEDVPEGGIWISKIHSSHRYFRYRVNIITSTGKHFDLQLILREDLSAASVLESIHWMEAVAGYPYGPPVLPRLGCYRPELGARSMVYLSELTVWEKIKQFSSSHIPGETFPNPNAWRKLFIEAFAVFFRGWRNSGNRIVPGAVSPNNVVVPELDFREGATILSLTGWFEYKNTLSLIKPMLRNFYQKAVAHYPWCKEHLDLNWIFDAAIEALGQDMASEFLSQLILDLATEKVKDLEGQDFNVVLTEYIEESIHKHYLPLSIHNALEKFNDWERSNPLAEPTAREQTVFELYKLYRLESFQEIIRYYLYRFTYFSNASSETLTIFDRLLDAMTKSPQKPALQLRELSELQDILTDSDDKDVFSRMIFPRYQSQQKVEVLKIGTSEYEQLIVHSYITDKQGETYTFREPVEPAEIGHLYQLFYIENLPISTSEQDKHFVVIDNQERTVAGIFYKFQKNNLAQLDNIVVTSPLRGRGIATAMIEDFCDRMAVQGVDVVKTHFFLQNFYLKLGFIVDKRWGGLVKFLSHKKSVDTGIEEDVISPY